MMRFKQIIFALGIAVISFFIFHKKDLTNSPTQM